MSRSGYSDECDDDLAAGRWRGCVASAIRGKRGQAFLRELLAALDALPEKKLVKNAFEQNGEVCALGSVAKARGMEMPKIEEDDYDEFDMGIEVGPVFGIADPMAREIMFINDDDWRSETPEQRFTRVRNWVASKIAEPPAPNSNATQRRSRAP